MKTNISKLALNFENLRKATSIELDLLAKGLAGVATANQNKQDKQKSIDTLFHSAFKAPDELSPLIKKYLPQVATG